LNIYISEAPDRPGRGFLFGQLSIILQEVRLKINKSSPPSLLFINDDIDNQ
jgi:hypothetical protein